MWIKKYIKNLALIVLGSCILAFGSFNFNYQNGVTEGGVLGLLLLIKNIFDISPSVTALIIDLSLFALGAKFFGKQFLVLSIFASLSFSSWYKMWESIGFIVPNLRDVYKRQGSVLLVYSDIMARMINPPYETPIGSLTALLGVPMFIYLVRKDTK